MSTHTLPRPSNNFDQDALTLAQQQDANTKWYIECLRDDFKPNRRDFGRWLPVVERIEETYNLSNGNREIAVAAVISSFRTNIPEFANLLDGIEVSTSQSPALQESHHTNFPPLLEGAYLPEGLSAGACPWLENYISYSKLVSPEGFSDFHEACGLWVLSVIAGRRVKLPLNKQYTPLMIALVARTSLYAKSVTAGVAVDVLYAAGLKWLLGSDETTPQRLLTDCAGELPKDYGEANADKKYRIERRLSMAAQRGWYYDELGQLLKAMSKDGGIMEALKGLLLKLDNCELSYEYSTQSRGAELIEKPYLALLGCMTPADMRHNAKSGSEYWGNGFFARFAFIFPPQGSGLDAPFQPGDFPVHQELSRPLREWHERLGVPTFSVNEIKDDKGKITKYDPVRGELPETELQFGEGVYDAWVRYRSALKHISTNLPTEDLDGSYQRLSIKAIRIAGLFASLSGATHISMSHWACAQEIAERWRASLHELYAQVAHAADSPSYAKRIEDEVLRVVRLLEAKGKKPTVRDMSDYGFLGNVESGRLKSTVEDMVRIGRLGKDMSGKSPRYSTVEED